MTREPDNPAPPPPDGGGDHGGDGDTPFFYRPGVIRALVVGTFVVSALLLLLDLVFVFGRDRHAAFPHGELPAETNFGFYAFYGFIAYMLLVVISQQIRRLLVRREGYYDE